MSLKSSELEKKYSKGELAKIILKTLACIGVVVVVAAMPGLGQVLKIFKPRNYREKQQLRQSLYKLKKRKLVRIYTKNGKDVVEITKNGQRKLLSYELEGMKIKVPKKWDKLWRVVIFDIPENRRGAREKIQMLLKEMGAYSIQKSTFVSPYEFKNEVDFIGEYFNLRKNIIYMTVKEMDQQQQLKKRFGL